MRGRGVRVFARRRPTDLRLGFEGLSALVRGELEGDPTSGELFLFVARHRMRAKILMWDGTGMCVYAKRLEQGRFAALWERASGATVELSEAELGLFLEGCRLLSKGPTLTETREGSVLLLNDGEEYTVTIESLQPVETFCLFFERGFVEDAFHSMTTGSTALLDSPDSPFIFIASSRDSTALRRIAI